MSNPALMMAISGSLRYTPATGPAFVKGNTHYEGSAVLSTTVWFNDADHTAHATAGNRLFAQFITINSRYASATPAGWTLLASQKGTGAVALQLFTKISDGTETSVTFTTSATYNKAAMITEWTPSKVGTITSNAFAIASGLTWTAGPTDAPVSPLAIPLFGYNYQNNRSGDTPTAPWVGQSTNKTSNVAGGGAYINGGFGYQPAPNAAATFAATSGTGTTTDAAWINVWIEPA
jgi:hypothetical protein